MQHTMSLKPPITHRMRWFSPLDLKIVKQIPLAPQAEFQKNLQLWDKLHVCPQETLRFSCLSLQSIQLSIDALIFHLRDG